MDTDRALDCARTSLIGLSVGDCFGETFFIDPDIVEDRIAGREIEKKPWYFTDDTVMGIGVYSTLKQYGHIHQDSLAAVFGRNYLLQPDRGYGGTAHAILRELGSGKDFRTVSPYVFDGMGSMGNGAAMRAGPIGAYFSDDLYKAAKEAVLSAEVTHSHPEGIAGAVAVAMAAALMLRKKQGSYAWEPSAYIRDVAELTPESDLKYKIGKAADLPAGSSMDFLVSVLGNGVKLTAMDTVPLALWCCAHYSYSLEEALWKAVSALGDRDTICAIVGSIVALNSFDIPIVWKQYLEDPLRSIFWME